MVTVIAVTVMLCIIVVAEYAMIVTAKRADEDAKRMFKEWSEKRGQNNDNKGVLSDDEERAN